MTPEEIVTNWIKNQLRPEGRKGIYIDDEATLIFDIKKAVESEREACAKIAEDKSKLIVQRGNSFDEGYSQGFHDAAQAIRARGGEK